MRVVFQLYLLLLFIPNTPAFASKDSLENVLIKAKGTVRMEILSKLAQIHRTDDLRKSIEYGEEHLALSRKVGNKQEEMKALNALGISYYYLGYYETTLDYFLKVLRVSEEMHDDKETGRALNNLGNIFDEIGDKEKAIWYYKRSLEIKERSEDKAGIANTLSNIGYVYNELGNTAEAFRFFSKALILDKQEGNVQGLFATLNNLGLCFLKKGNYDSALYYLYQADTYENDIESNYDKAEFYNNLGNVYLKTGKVSNAVNVFQKAMSLAQSVKARSLVKDSYKGLSEAHYVNNNPQTAYECLEKYLLINDSLHNEMNSRRIASLESEYKIQKREQEINLLIKEAEIQNLILSKNRYVNYFLYAGLILFIGLIIVIFQKYKFKTEANHLLKVQNKLIEAKNANITDSINYAKGIQEAILHDPRILENAFKEYFIICKPRDIVNGDFYWFADKGDYMILAVVDCTGHGVPGAFMNILGNSLLNQIINDQNIISPSKILQQLNTRILTMLYQEGLSATNYGGMDIGIILYNKKTRRLIFSGAKHVLYIFKDNNLEVIKGNKTSLGGIYQKDRIFDEHEFSLSISDSFYLFTDGLIDQFGEKSNKKFMNHRLKELIFSVHCSSMQVQASKIEEKLIEWKGNQEQTDDLLIIGLKI
ncbi:MAG: tetratricopeptide repeat protein [Bacteroidota bacterium]|nr:tetratricopeptide repeat protein [Bacteroidota bacterium]